VPRHPIETGDVHEWLPYSFSIVGAQKSGTSTLSTALDRHPQVARAPRKELQFFTREDVDWSRPDYRGYRAPRRKPQHLIAGDATPAYLFWPGALERMRDYNPDLRLIAVFRDPLERLFSHWTMLRGRWTTSPDWPEFITEFRPSTTPTALPDVPSLAFKQRSGVARGYYGDQLTRGLTIFPREQWLWLEFRSMLADFSGTLDQLTDFLGVDRYHRHPEPGRQMSGPDRVVGTPPSAADLTSLAKLYEADLAQFGDVSGLDVDAWPTSQILSGRLDPEDLATKFAARVEALTGEPPVERATAPKAGDERVKAG
jgi:hypothetical protein